MLRDYATEVKIPRDKWLVHYTFDVHCPSDRAHFSCSPASEPYHPSVSAPLDFLLYDQ
jgi:hypothetical protein